MHLATYPFTKRFESRHITPMAAQGTNKMISHPKIPALKKSHPDKMIQRLNTSLGKTRQM